jgi:hypothetical protein
VVICPGGGYWNLAWDLEGEEVAARLNALGITALVLRIAADADTGIGAPDAAQPPPSTRTAPLLVGNEKVRGSTPLGSTMFSRKELGLNRLNLQRKPTTLPRLSRAVHGCLRLSRHTNSMPDGSKLCGAEERRTARNQVKR